MKQNFEVVFSKGTNLYNLNDAFPIGNTWVYNLIQLFVHELESEIKIFI